jgi:WD40 repeat protein
LNILQGGRIMQRETAPLIINPPLFLVNNVAWSPNGKRIAIANQDGIFQVWKAKTGEFVSTHYESERSLQTFILGWSADNKRIISRGDHGSIQGWEVWKAATGMTIFTFSADFPIVASHDGKYVVSGGSSSGNLLVWDTSTGQQVLTVQTQTDEVTSIQWSPNDKLFATTNLKLLSNNSLDYTVQVWDATTGEHLSTYRGPGKGASIDSFSWSPDSKQIVAASGGSEQIWDAATGTPLLTYQGNAAVASSLAWSPDGTHIASWSLDDHSVLVWDPATGNSTFTFGDFNHPVTSVTWLPNGKRLVVVGGVMMQELDAATGHPVLTYTTADNQYAVTASPDGRHLASVDSSGTSANCGRGRVNV